MAYRDIPNLYKSRHILLFKEAIASEKIHGTSANVSFKSENIGSELKFFSGGANHMLFMEFFNREKLLENFKKLGQDNVTVYGEAYGGKLQGMRKTYGDKLYFTAFEVRIGGIWLSVEKAQNVCSKLGIEFVPYERIPCNMKAIDAERARPSVVSKWRIGAEDKEREGIVLRPIEEMALNNGGRIIVKHKNENFSERKSKRDTKVTKEELEVIKKANDIAEEWVTPMRLRHVIDSIESSTGIKVESMENTKAVMTAMIADVLRESKDEIVDSKQARTAMCRMTAKLLKKYFQDNLREENVIV